MKEKVGKWHSWLISRKNTQPPQVELQKPATIEDAISAWENDQVNNKKGHKIVRGRDGKPVEVVNHGRDSFAFVVDGVKIPFIQKDLTMSIAHLNFQQDTQEIVLYNTYQITGVKRFDVKGFDVKGFDVKARGKHQGFVFGLPIANPETH